MRRRISSIWPCKACMSTDVGIIAGDRIYHRVLFGKTVIANQPTSLSLSVTSWASGQTPHGAQLQARDVTEGRVTSANEYRQILGRFGWYTIDSGEARTGLDQWRAPAQRYNQTRGLGNESVMAAAGSMGKMLPLESHLVREIRVKHSQHISDKAIDNSWRTLHATTVLR